MILADENIDAHFVSILRSKNIEVLHIREGHRGISDEDVIKLSKEPLRIILTEDKDFGEWVFAHQEKNISVILLRYRFQELEDYIHTTKSFRNQRQRFIWEIYYRNY